MKLMKKSKKGFTLVEIVIVVAVLAILAAIAIPVVGNVINDANNAADAANAKVIESTVKLALAKSSSTSLAATDIDTALTNAGISADINTKGNGTAGFLINSSTYAVTVLTTARTTGNLTTHTHVYLGT